jgi:hypothetical protein
MMSHRNLSTLVFLIIGLANAGTAAADTLTFQQGDGGAYSETAATSVTLDTHVNFGASPHLTLFAFDPDVVVISFVQFPLIIGDDVGQIPPGSVISSATLELTRIIDDNAQATFHQVYTAWDEYTVSGFTWADVAGTDYGPIAGTMPSDYAFTVGSVDITSVVQEWSSGAANLGVLLRPTPGTLHEARYHSDDATEPTTRPKLTVEFNSPPVPAASTTWGAIKALYR